MYVHDTAHKCIVTMNIDKTWCFLELKYYNFYEIFKCMTVVSSISSVGFNTFNKLACEMVSIIVVCTAIVAVLWSRVIQPFYRHGPVNV